MGCSASRTRGTVTLDVVEPKRRKLKSRPELTHEMVQIVRETWKVVKLDIARAGVILFLG